MDWFQGVHQTTGVIANKSFMFNQIFEKRINEIFFKYSHIKETKLYPRKVIFLDKCSTIDLFYNEDLVENITNYGKKITVQENGVTLVVTHKEKLTRYKQDAWFRKYAITNITDIKNLIKQYWVIYDSIDQTFVLYREDQEWPNMKFKMHESGLNFYNPTTKAVVLINTISRIKQIFSYRQINGAVQAETLFAKIGYPSVKYFRWIV